MKKFLTNFLSVLMALAVLMTTTVVAFAADPVAMSNGTCTVQLSKTRYVYNGKSHKPSVTVKTKDGRTLKNGVDYALSCPARTSVGETTVRVNFKGAYTGSASTSYAVVPKGTAVKSVQSQLQGFKVTWKKQTKQTTGYQIQYATNKQFKGATVKTVNGNKNTSKTIAGLANYKTYYVRARAFKEVKSGNKKIKIYSGWAQYKTVKTKGVPAVKLNSAKSDYYAFKVNYNRNSNVTGYKICYATNSNFKSSKTITKKNTKTKAKSYTTTVGKLSGNQKYYVKVRTYKTVKSGKKSKTYYSNWSSVRVVTTKKQSAPATPTGFKLSAPKYKKLKMTWNATKGASGYQVQYEGADDLSSKKVTKEQFVKDMDGFFNGWKANEVNKWAGNVFTSNTSYTKTNLYANTYYVGRVRSYKTVNGKRVCVKRSAISRNCDENAGD
ncbi:MAG: hypothetical protein PUE56_02340 [Clostridium sp.]|nr:hypothetical protein [Clostridium sp.]